MAERDAAPDLSGSIGALSAAVLGAALDVAGLAVIITDAALDPPGPVIRYANAHFEAVTGHAAAELLGQSPRILQGPDTDRAVLRQLRRDLEERRHFIGAAVNYRKDGTPYLNEWVIMPILGSGGMVTHWVSIQRDATREGEPHPGAEALRQRTLALLATVRAIASRTLTVSGEGRAFGDRLAALGRAQGLAGAAGADLGTILRGEIEPLRPPAGQVVLEGPAVALEPGVAEPLALALHELAANAARHGALATAAGRLSVTWRMEEAKAGRRLVIDWREHGVAQPGAAGGWQGFGWKMIEGALSFALGGETRLGLEADGLSCTIALPLEG
ncbi:MAG TPA: PAS domain-containing protein [Roseomonas sp.]|jgi:PAS domain S-box-containing protein